MYDAVIIGSSPVSLLEAIHLAETGRKVRLIERESSLGGAWGLHDCLGLSAVEISPHTFVPDPVVHEIIARKFKVDLEIVDPPPTYCYWDSDNGSSPAQEFPLHNVLAERVRDLFYRARRARREQGSKRETIMLPLDLLLNFRQLRGYTRLPIVYPKGGLVRLLENAAKILDDLGVDVSCGEDGKRIDWRSGREGHFVVNTSLGEIQARQVSLPRIIHLDGFGYDGIDVPAYFLDNHSTHFVFKSRTATKGQLRFLKVTGSPYFELINDVTPYCVGNLSSDERVISCRCVRSMVFDERDIDKYLDHLRELDYLPKGDSLLEFQVNQAEDRVLAYYMHRRLERLFGDKLVFLGAHDGHITNAIKEFNATRWNFV